MIVDKLIELNLTQQQNNSTVSCSLQSSQSFNADSTTAGEQRRIDHLKKVSARRKEDFTCKRLFQSKHLDNWLERHASTVDIRRVRREYNEDQTALERELQRLINRLKMTLSNADHPAKNISEFRRKKRMNIGPVEGDCNHIRI